MSPISDNTKAILLLTAPLIAGRASSSAELLTPGEYKRLARHLRETQRQPADLLTPDAPQLIDGCRAVIEEARMKSLLGRGFLLSQAMERWQARAIWVLSRADADYPRRLKVRLKEDAPPILYGCGDIGLLDGGGLAVVGSRHVDQGLVDYTIEVGRLSAGCGRTVVSGGARGIDQAAMRGAIEAGGKVIGVLADSLERAVMNRENRNLLLDGQLVLVSPYDPGAGFNVGHAMQRNKLIYAFADSALVVSSDYNKGGTWAGAIEQLEQWRFGPVYVRSAGEAGPGLEGLRRKGALPWPEPTDVESLERVFAAAEQAVTVIDAQPGVSLFVKEPEPFAIAGSRDSPGAPREDENVLAFEDRAAIRDEPPSAPPLRPSIDAKESATETGRKPADALFAMVRSELCKLLVVPMKDAQIAAELQVSTAQARVWLDRLVEEGVLEKKKRPAAYVIRKSGLFG